jgi:hypothetical protein
MCNENCCGSARAWFSLLAFLGMTSRFKFTVTPWLVTSTYNRVILVVTTITLALCIRIIPSRLAFVQSTKKLLRLDGYLALVVVVVVACN